MPTIEIDPQRRTGYLLRAECIVPAPLEQVFAFFADAYQLETLTPPWMKFQVVTAPPIEMRPGLMIDYKLRVRGVSMRWQSEITTWEPGRRFVDEMRRGPYRYWQHEHLFEPCKGGTRVIDLVRYAVPGGRLVHWLLVRSDLERVFAFRQQKLAELFPAAAPSEAANSVS